MKVMVAVRSGLIAGLTAASEAIAAVPVLPVPVVAATGEAAAMPFGSSSTRAMSRAAVETGCSRKRSRAAGAGGGDVDAKAVDDVAARHGAGRAVGEPGQPVLAGRQRRVGHQLVVARLQRAGCRRC